MVIVAVDNHSRRLARFEKYLQTIFPNETIVTFIDPMLAAKYSVQKNADIVFSEINMKRMTGWQLIDVVRKWDENIRIYLIAEDMESVREIEKSRATGYLVRPVTGEAVNQLSKCHAENMFI